MTHTLQFRVRYSETDAMRTYYNARVLEWFEVGRSELCRASGKPYTEWEAEGLMLPLVEAHVEYLGPARYDDLLTMTTQVAMLGRVRMRFEVAIAQAADGRPVCRGYTVHAITDGNGRPIRPPDWIAKLIGGAHHRD